MSSSPHLEKKKIKNISTQIFLFFGFLVSCYIPSSFLCAEVTAVAHMEVDDVCLIFYIHILKQI